MDIKLADVTLVIELLEDVMGLHSDKESCDYNECDTDPCAWCDDAKKVIDNIHKNGPQYKLLTSQTEGSE